MDGELESGRVLELLVDFVEVMMLWCMSTLMMSTNRIEGQVSGHSGCTEGLKVINLGSLPCPPETHDAAVSADFARCCLLVHANAAASWLRELPC